MKFPMPSGFCALLVVAVLITSSSRAEAQYPKVNLSVGYQVDPNWPLENARRTWKIITGVAVDAKDRIWFVNQIEPTVQAYDAEGKLVAAWGQGLFKGPHFIRIDREQNIWIADQGRHVVRKLTAEGDLLLTLGTPDEPGEDERHLNKPTDMAISPLGDVFVSDGYGNNRVVHFDASGRFVSTWGKLGTAPGEFSQPHSIVMDSQGRLYVADRNNGRIQVFDQSGRFSAEWRNLMIPWGLWMTPQDQLLVSGCSPRRWSDGPNLGNPPIDQLVMKFNTDGRVLENWSFPLAKPDARIAGDLDWVHGIAADSRGNLYLGDVAGERPAHRIQKFLRLSAER